MNKRIKLLLEDADMGYLFYKDEMLPGMVNPNSLKKFAELIVRECAEQVKNLHVNDYGISGAEIIREHFGVEE